MKTLTSRLIRRDGSTHQESNNQSIDEIVEGVRRLLERDNFSIMYLFRRHPVGPDGEVNTHIYVEVEK
jgi:hypothetical protein